VGEGDRVLEAGAHVSGTSSKGRGAAGGSSGGGEGDAAVPAGIGHLSAGAPSGAHPCAPALTDRRRRFQSGFTIIELMVVMTLIVVLATIGLAQYRNSVVRSKEAVLKENLFRMRDAIDQYYADKNRYPGSLDDLVSDGYLRTVPKDPITDSLATWQTVAAQPDPNNPISDLGVFDVKSGADTTALDGSRYADW
jgi:general secretion pathway protein G